MSTANRVKNDSEIDYENNPNPYTAITMFCKGGVCEKVKLLCSFVVVTLLIIVVFTGISLQYCVLKVHPALGFFICEYARA